MLQSSAHEIKLYIHFVSHSLHLLPQFLRFDVSMSGVSSILRVNIAAALNNQNALKQRDFSLSLRFLSTIRQARALKCVLHYVCVKYKKNSINR